MPRVEHAQLVDPADVGRFATLGIAASMQPVHLRSDVDKARRLWGDRADAVRSRSARSTPAARSSRSGPTPRSSRPIHGRGSHAP
jgi:predicted amidohydrolase YtcJ